MDPPELAEDTSELVQWQSSSPDRNMHGLLALDLACTATPGRISSDPGVVDVPDPATELMDKYDNNALASSPPPTWPAVTPVKAMKQTSDCSEVVKSKNLLRMYSPGYLKRMQSRPTMPAPKRLAPPGITFSNIPGSSSPLGSEIKLQSTSDNKENVLSGSLGPNSQALRIPSPIPEANETVENLDSANGSSGSAKVALVLDSDDEIDWDSLSPIDVNESVVPSMMASALPSAIPSAAPSDKDESFQIDLSDIDIDTSSINIRPESAVPEPRDLDVTFENPLLHRYFVSKVFNDTESKRIVLSCVHKEGVAEIFLEQSWALSDVEPGDIVHVIGSYDIKLENVIVNHKQNLLIVIPDLLVPCTTVADSFRCDRQVVLRSRHRTAVDQSKPLVYGSIIHELIQQNLVSDKPFNMTSLKTTLRELINEDFLEDLAMIGVDTKEADKEISTKLMGIIKWARSYVTAEPKETMSIYRSTSTQKVAITSIDKLEEEFWSPLYGLKGKIDVSVKVAVPGAKAFPSMLEIKTGKSTDSASHRAQVMLYCLLMEERNKSPVPWGMLYYSDSGTMAAVSPLRDEVRGLIQKRNTLSRYLDDKQKTLPPLVDDSFTCKFCTRQESCALYAAASDTDLAGFSLAETFTTHLQHIKPQHIEFFKKWDNLLNLEGAEVGFRIRKVWTQSGEEREEEGECFASVAVDSDQGVKIKGISTNYLYHIRNCRAKSFPANTRLLPGAAAIFSDSTTIAIARGFVTKINDDETLLVTVDQPLLHDVSYRVDYDEYAQVMSISQSNLVNLFSHDNRLIDLIVDLKAPRFNEETDVVIPTQYNEDQTLAIKKVMQMRDYALILGMPGTGKTTTIVGIADMLVQQGKTVLISGFTHSAVDNIVAKIIKHGTSVLRLGNVMKVHEDVLEVLGGHGKNKAHNQQELEDIYMKPPIVATTSLAISSWLFSRRKFDVCIMDEASQLTLPMCIGPLRFADKFVLVGDHYQLSPLVQNKQAAQGGLGESLFKTLCDAHPQAVVSLEHQYRMSEDIMKLSSMLIYNGQLKSGSREISEQKLELPLQVDVPLWLKPVLEPMNRVVFLNTDSLPGPETERPDGMANYHEADIVCDIVKRFHEAGITSRQMGVISIYRAQRQIIKERLSDYSRVEVLTADQAQGRDKDCIIISLVRSNTERKVGKLLRDWRRINVTFTRAKSKLVIIGSLETLKAAPVLEKFLHVIEAEGWVYNASREALDEL